MRLQRVRSRILPVTSSAAIAGVGELGGKFTPVVMLDLTEHPDVQEVIRVHGHLESGDCAIEWGATFGSGERTLLHLEFLRPIALRVAIAFDLSQFAAVVDNIVFTRAMYLQHGVTGDTYMSSQDTPHLLVEVPDVGFAPHWERMYRRAVVRMMRAEGMPARAAKAAAPDFIAKMRSLMWTQLPPAADA